MYKTDSTGIHFLNQQVTQHQGVIFNTYMFYYSKHFNSTARVPVLVAECV